MIRSLVLMLLLCPTQTMGSGTCFGKFLNPLQAVCWSCLFPLTIGSSEVARSAEDLPDPHNPASPFCACGTPLPRPGIAVGFWAVNNLVEITRTPFCFPSLGGLQLAKPEAYPHGSVSHDLSGAAHATYHVHWYVYPLLSLFNEIFDAACVEGPNFDVAWITELDPLWLDDTWSFILAPESVLFSDLGSESACQVEAARMQSPKSKPLDHLFWCLGAQGSVYPLTGHVKVHTGSVRSALLLAERMTYRMHRIGALQLSWVIPNRPQSICHQHIRYVAPKSHYRYQMSYPIPQSRPPDGCRPFGASTLMWQGGRAIPIKGEDHSYLIWRKVNCCA